MRQRNSPVFSISMENIVGNECCKINKHYSLTDFHKAFRLNKNLLLTRYSLHKSEVRVQNAMFSCSQWWDSPENGRPLASRYTTYLVIKLVSDPTTTLAVVNRRHPSDTIDFLNSPEKRSLYRQPKQPCQELRYSRVKPSSRKLKPLTTMRT